MHVGFESEETYFLVVSAMPIEADDGRVVATGQVSNVARLCIDQAVGCAGVDAERHDRCWSRIRVVDASESQKDELQARSYIDVRKETWHLPRLRVLAFVIIIWTICDAALALEPLSGVSTPTLAINGHCN